MSTDPGPVRRRGFAARHRFLLIVLWAQVPLLAVWGLLGGFDLVDVGLISLLLIIPAVIGMVAPGQQLSSAAVALGLVACSVVFIGFGPDLDGSHFHFFATVAAVSLYRDRMPLLVAVGAIVAYHFGVGLVGPGELDVIWASIHSAFVLLAAAVAVAGWSLDDRAGRRPLSEERLRLSFEEAPIGMAVLKPSGEFLEVNKAMSRMLGYEGGRLEGQVIRSIVHGDDMSELGDAWEEMANSETHSAAAWLRCMTASGGSIWGRVSLSLVPWQPELPALVTMQIEDGGRAHEEELRLQALLDDRDHFVSAIGGELTTSLALLVEMSEKGDRDLHRLQGQAREIASVVADLVVSARAGREPTRVTALPIDAGVLCQDVVTSVPGAEHVEMEVGATELWADPGLTRKVLFGLVANAVRYGGSNVAVRTMASGPDTIIEIVDDGPGLPESERERIFRSDLRHGRAVTRPASVGLSLSVGRYLARLMDGDLSYRRTGDGENVFELRLPSEEIAPADHTITGSMEILV